MKIMLLNGSPKLKNSSSEIIINGLCQRLEDTNKCVVQMAIQTSDTEFLEAIKDCSALVIIFPLYVDGIPSHLLRLLDNVKNDVKALAPEIVVYTVVNNGFYEAQQNILAIEMIQNFCELAGLKWKQGMGVGAGGMLGAAPIGSGPMKNLGDALDILSKNICASNQSDNMYINPNFPRFLYKMGAHFSWRQLAKKNGLKRKDIYTKF